MRAESRYEMIAFESKDGIGVLTLDRPSDLNALNAQLLREMNDVLRHIQADRAIRALVITGRGRAFCAGADVRELGRLESISDFIAYSDSCQATIEALAAVDLPTIAAVNGLALGGGFEVALACDLRLAGRAAGFGLPEVKLGLIPGAGGTQRLARDMPSAVASAVILAGQRLGPDEALRYNLVNAVVPDDALIGDALSHAAELARRPPLAVRYAKRLIRLAHDNSIAAASGAEHQAATLLFATEDAKEAISAFAEKRPPTFHGR